MSYEYAILVAGAGETSRANVEALVEDYYYGHGSDGVMVLAFDKRPSQGQIFAAKVAMTKKLDLVVVSPPGGVFDMLPSASYLESESPFETAVETLKTAKSWEAFLLWDPEDLASVEALSFCDKQGVVARDLRNGLVDINNLPIPKFERPLPTTEEPVKEEIRKEAIAQVPTALEEFANMIADLVVEKLKK